MYTRCIKTSISCIVAASIFLVVYIFTKPDDLFLPEQHIGISKGVLRNGLAAKDTESVSLEKAKSLSSPVGGDGTAILSGNVLLKSRDQKGSKWSAEARTLIEDELHWSAVGGKEMKMEEIIMTYSVECQEGSPGRSEKTSLPDLILLNDSVIDTNALKAGETPATASTPCILYINTSKIFGADRGAFSKVALPRGIIFGPYKGEKIQTADPHRVVRSGYVWALGAVDYDEYLYIEAENENTSNWLRFINCARFEEEQNLYPIKVEQDMYYFLYKDVLPHTELLVWYGKGYGNELGLWLLSTVKAPGLAPPRSQIVCPTCRELPTVEEVENQKRREGE